MWEETTLNSMIPLWRKQKSEVKPEEYNDFYKNKFYDYEDPAVVIHTGRRATPPLTPCCLSPAMPR